MANLSQLLFLWLRSSKVAQSAIALRSSKVEGGAFNGSRSLTLSEWHLTDAAERGQRANLFALYRAARRKTKSMAFSGNEWHLMAMNSKSTTDFN